MKRSLRFDTFRIDATRRDQNGYLEADASVTRTGVFVYRHPNGDVSRELRHPDEVFKADSLATLKNRPATIGHPATGKLNAKNTRRLSVGAVVGEVTHDGRLVNTKLQFTDEEAIDKILDEKTPMREISCGYEAEVVKQDGVFNGEAYDHVQKNIVYNHVALVPRGRAGREVGVRLDAEDAMMADEDEQKFVSKCMADPKKLSEYPDEKQRSAVCYSMFERGDSLESLEILDDDHQNNPGGADKGVLNMTSKLKIKRDAVATKTFKADAFTLEIDGTPEAAEKALDAIGVRYDAAVAHIVTLEAENQTMRGKLDAAGDSGRVNAAQLDSLVKERTDAIGTAHYLGLKNYNALETDQIKKLVVLKAFPNINPEELTPAYIAGRYDAVCDRIKQEHKNLESLATLKDVTENPGLFGLKDKNDGLSPREQLAKDTNDMWKGETRGNA